MAADTREAFITHRWPAWRTIAAAHAQLGEPLQQSLALEPIHEAWISELIPRGSDAAARKHLLEAGNDRRACQAALQEAVTRTKSKLLQSRLDAMGRYVTRDYAGHPVQKVPPYVPPAKVTPAGPPREPARWEPLFQLTVTDASVVSTSPTVKVSGALEAALRWLAAHQSPNGSWEAAGFDKWCDGQKNVVVKRPTGLGRESLDHGVTGLALCAFLGAGFTHRGTHPFNRAVARGLAYLRSQQDDEGCFGPRRTQRYIYSHATAALAFTEAYRATGSAVVRQPAQRALDFIAMARNPYFAWRYGIKPGDNDTSVSGWMMMALKSAQLANKSAIKGGKPAPLTIDESAFDGLKAWLDKVTDPDYGRVGYVQRGIHTIRYAGMHEKFPTANTGGCTPVGMLARMFSGEHPRKSKPIKLGAQLCVNQLPTWDPAESKIDMVYWYYATLALHQVGGKAWLLWRTALGKALDKGQRKNTDACEYLGSFDPAGKWGAMGGRVYATAMMALMQAAYDGHDTLFAFGGGR